MAIHLTVTRRLMLVAAILVSSLVWSAVKGAAAPAAQAGGTDDAGQALIDVALLAVGFLLVTAGGIGLYALWYLRGRDPHTGLVAEIIERPPDDLPAGAAGTLLDERADHCDVVATLVDLGHRQVIQINEVHDRGRRDFQLTLVAPDIPVRPFEAELLRALFGAELTPGEETRLSAVRGGFERAQPEIKSRLYAELVERRYFPRSPEAERRWWRNAGRGLVVAAVIVGVLAIAVFGNFAWFPAVIAVILGLLLVRLSRSMPRKTPTGAEAAAKWRAFRRYLSSIERYEQLTEARDVFDRYLPYAVAFELDRSWVRKFASVGAPAPAWYGADHDDRRDWDIDPLPGTGWDSGPVIIPTGGFGDAGGGSSLPDLSAPVLPGLPDMPDLQGMSDFAGDSLQSVSDGLGGLLDAAGSVFESFDGFDFN